MAKEILVCLLILLMVIVVFGSVPTYTGCGTDIEGVSEGRIDYSLDGQRYSNRDICSWEITVDDGQRLSVRFQELELEDGDNLIIKDGKGETIVSLSNNTLPKPISIHGDKMYIQLFSDSSSKTTAFMLTWRIHNQDMKNMKNSISKSFLIKHKISGKYVYFESMDNIRFSTDISYLNLCHFRIIDDKWGNLLVPGYGRPLIYDFEFGEFQWDSPTPIVGNLNLFAIDQASNLIISRNGLILQPRGDGFDKILPADSNKLIMSDPPANDAPEWLLTSVEFILVDPENPTEEVFPYGKPTIIGDWNVVFSVMNPKAEHTYSIKTKVGHVQSAGSTSKSFKYKWEFTGASAGFSLKDGFSASVQGDQKLQSELQQSSSNTWNTETDIDLEFKVEAGRSVTIWQRHYIGQQFKHVGVFQSNIFADTESINEQPKDDTPRRFL